MAAGSILISCSVVGTQIDPGVAKISEHDSSPHEFGGIQIPPTGSPVSSLTRSTPLNGQPLSRNHSQPSAAVKKSSPQAGEVLKFWKLSVSSTFPVNSSILVSRSLLRRAQIEPAS